MVYLREKRIFGISDDGVVGTAVCIRWLRFQVDGMCENCYFFDKLLSVTDRPFSV